MARREITAKNNSNKTYEYSLENYTVRTGMIADNILIVHVAVRPSVLVTVKH